MVVDVYQARRHIKEADYDTLDQWILNMKELKVKLLWPRKLEREVSTEIVWKYCFDRGVVEAKALIYKVHQEWSNLDLIPQSRLRKEWEDFKKSCEQSKYLHSHEVQKVGIVEIQTTRLQLMVEVKGFT